MQESLEVLGTGVNLIKHFGVILLTLVCKLDH